MKPLRVPHLLALLLAAAAIAPVSVFAASPDNDVEWSGISHVAWQDRRPLCPVAGESFQVRVQAYRNDLTALRIQLVAPAPATIEAAVVAQRGPYDIWAAQIPATAANVESYYIELVDGTDTDYYGTSGVSDNVPAPGLEFALNFTTLEHAPLGATLATGGAVFRVWAPNAANATVSGEFNDWGAGAPMLKTGEHFAVFVAGAAMDRKQYKYRFNGGTLWKPDARSRQLRPSGPENSYIENPFRYSWGDTDFVTPPLEQMVIYQLHVGTFSGGPSDPVGGTVFPSGYVDVANRVGHLKNLGINAVQLNPITEFPGDHSAGYNPITQWGPESKYGTPDDLRYMIDMLHRNGIAVLLDIVWNHVDAVDNHLWQYDGSHIYFDFPVVDTPWGAQADFDKVAVRDYYANSALMWLEEYHVDGFRMDATSYMDMGPHAAAGYVLMQRFNNEIDNRWADKVAIAEELPDDSYITRPTPLGGAGFDSQYHDTFVDNLRQEIFDAAAGDPEMYKIATLVNGNGLYLSNKSVLNYLELHDEAWPPGGKRLVKAIDTTAPHDDVFAKGRTKLGQGIVMTAPGVPEILMGTEWLESRDFGTDDANRIDWSKKTTYAAIHAYYQKLIGLRRASPALWANAPHQVFLNDEAQNVIAFRRYSGLKQLVVIANFANADRIGYRVGLPMSGDWIEVLNSQALEFDGNGVGTPGTFAAEPVASNGFPQSALINAPRMGLVILAPAGIPVSVGEGSGIESRVQLTRISPSPARERTTIDFILPRAARARLAVLDVAGREVAVLADRELAAGAHRVGWDGRDAQGERVGPGVYFVRLLTPDGYDARKLALVP